MTRHLVRRTLAAAMMGGALLVSAVSAQVPARFENLKVLPKDISRDSLTQIMRGFAFALGVRCQYCHAENPDTTSRQRILFASDDKVQKRTARFMLRMADSLNRVVLAALPERRTPTVTIGCVTCHRGNPVPQTLETMLAGVIDRSGVDSAVARYKALRATDMTSGRWDFSEWSMNELARKLGERGKTAEAIAMLQLNQEYYPNSADIDFALGELYLKGGDKDKAITRFRAVLTKQPNNQRARQRLQELGVAPG